VLAQRCEEVGRPPGDVAVTTTGALGPARSVGELVERFGKLAEAGVDLAIVDLPDPADEVARAALTAAIPQVAPLGRPAPVVLVTGEGRARAAEPVEGP
jgi:hypothetical protein